MRDALAALPADEYPLTVGVADEMGDYGSNRHYEVALAALLNGVTGARSAATTTTR